MDIFVMRHGEAEVMAKSDRERHLNRRVFSKQFHKVSG